MSATWPVHLRGVTESLVATLGPNDRYNFAALGIHSGSQSGTESTGGEHSEPANVTARTWGRTRTWRNFCERNRGVVQFVSDPVVFTDAALGILERDDPVHDDADAWVRVSVQRLDDGRRDGTQWVDWKLIPEESQVERTAVPTFNRGYAAVVEATVAASRLDVDGYDTERMRERLDYFEDVVDRCGGPREREAMEKIRDYSQEV